MSKKRGASSGPQKRGRAKKSKVDDEFLVVEPRRGRVRKSLSQASALPTRIAKKASSVPFLKKLRSCLLECWPAGVCSPDWKKLAQKMDVQVSAVKSLVDLACETSSFREFFALVKASRPVLESSAGNAHWIVESADAGPLAQRGVEALRWRAFSAHTKEASSKWRRVSKMWGGLADRARREYQERGLVKSDGSMTLAWKTLLAPDARWRSGDASAFASKDNLFSALQMLAKGQLEANIASDGKAVLSERSINPKAVAVATNVVVLEATESKLEQAVEKAGNEGVAMRSVLAIHREEGLKALMAMWKSGKVLVLSGQSDAWIVHSSHRSQFEMDGEVLNAAAAAAAWTGDDVAEEWKELVRQLVYKKPGTRMEDLDKLTFLGHAVLFQLVTSLMEMNVVTAVVNSEGSVSLLTA
jgi:hypothetical protein